MSRPGTEAGFWARVVHDPSGCWLWSGPTQTRGYGDVRIGGRRGLAHRFAYEFTNGPIPEGLVVCHRCDNHLCVRPDHLFLGSQAENLRDMCSKERQAKGARNANARLTDEAVAELRERARSGEPLKELAAEFGIGRTTASSVVRGTTWRHVATAPFFAHHSRAGGGS